MDNIVMRHLRHQYSISLSELATAAGISNQAVSAIELGYTGYTAGNLLTMQRAFLKVIQQRFELAGKLQRDFQINQNWLFNNVQKEE